MPTPKDTDENDFDNPGTLAWYATLLEDSTTQVLMDSRDTGTSIEWQFGIFTPEFVKPVSYMYGSVKFDSED